MTFNVEEPINSATVQELLGDGKTVPKDVREVLGRVFDTDQIRQLVLINANTLIGNDGHLIMVTWSGDELDPTEVNVAELPLSEVGQVQLRFFLPSKDGIAIVHLRGGEQFQIELVESDARELVNSLRRHSRDFLNSALQPGSLE